MKNEELWENYDYNPLTGALYYRTQQGNRIKKGDKVGSISRQGYWITKIKGKQTRLNRMIWQWVTGREPSGVVDHINRNRLDDHWGNLRDVSNAFNVANNDSKGYGFYPYERGGQWVVQLSFDGKKTKKKFRTEEEARAFVREFRMSNSTY